MNSKALQMCLRRIPSVRSSAYLDNDLSDLVFFYLLNEMKGVYTFTFEGFMESVCSNSQSL